MDSELFENLKIRSKICNIHLIQVADYLLDEMSREYSEILNKERPKIGEWIWVCGPHGYEGVLNDGGIYYWAYDLDGLLLKIASHKETARER